MVAFMVVHDARTKKPVGLVLSKGRDLGWLATGEASVALKILGRIPKTFVEDRKGDSVVRREVKRGDSDFLAALRYRLVAPLAPLLLGVDRKSYTLQQAGAKLWRLLIDAESHGIPHLVTA